MILSDICEFIVDCPHTTAKDEGQGYPLIRTPNIGKGRLILNDVHRVSEAVYNNRNFRAVPQDDDLIFAREAPAGNVAIIKNGEKVCLGQRTVLLRPDKSMVDPNYLVYYLLAPNQQYKLLGSANGATVAHVNLPIIRNLLVDLPDIEKQRKIANTLSAYDDLIENNQKQIKLLEEAAQRLYKEWFVDLRFPGYENAPIADGVPEGWSIRKLETFGNIITGKTPSTANESYYNGIIPFVKIPDMHNTIYPIITESTLSEEGANTQKNKFIPKNSILVSCIATVGLVNIAVEECQTNQQINSIVLNDLRDLYYLYFSTKGLKMLLDGVGSNGATMANVNKSKFANIEILYPTVELRNQFYDFCKPIFEKILVLSQSIIGLKNSRDQLLPKLMSGEIEV